jgi:hypothetical protein
MTWRYLERHLEPKSEGLRVKSMSEVNIEKSWGLVKGWSGIFVIVFASTQTDLRF